MIESILFKKDYGISRRIKELAALTWTFVQNVLKYNKDVRELLPDNRERLLWINTCSSDKRRGTQRDREQDLSESSARRFKSLRKTPASLLGNIAIIFF